MPLESLFKLPADEASSVRETFDLAKLGNIAGALKRLGINQAAQAKVLEFVFSHPEILPLLLKLGGVLFSQAAQTPATPGAPAHVPTPAQPAPEEPAPPALVWPAKCDVRIGSLDNRHGEEVKHTLDAKGVVRPLGHDSIDDGTVIRLEPFWADAADAGITIAEADENDGENAHLRWRQRVVCEYGNPAISRVVEGGLGRPDEEQNTDEHSFVRIKRYNETRGQVIPVRLGAKGGPYRLWVEMDTPAGVVKSNVITVEVVR